MDSVPSVRQEALPHWRQHLCQGPLGYDRGGRLGVRALVHPTGAGAELHTLLIFTNLPLNGFYASVMCQRSSFGTLLPQSYKSKSRTFS